MPSFTHNTMKNILGLQNVIIYKIEREKDKFLVKIGQPRKPSECPYCEHGTLHNHGSGRIRHIKHGKTPSGKKVVLEWTSRRFKCPRCNRTFSKSPPESLVSGKKSYSHRYKIRTLNRLKNNSFSQVAKDLSLSYPTIRNMLEEAVTRKTLLTRIPEQGALSIGMDHHSNANRSLALTITLIQPERRLLGILPDCSTEQFKTWVEKNLAREQRERVTEIAMDMRVGYSKVLKKLFPNAKYVIDKFHVLTYLDRMLIEKHRLAREVKTRSGEKLPAAISSVSGLMQALKQSPHQWSERTEKKMKISFTLFPELKRLYSLKEEVKNIYRAKDKVKAGERLERVIEQLPEKQQKTLSKHSEQILNYFDKHTTNAFTEGVHTKFKLLKRISFGIRNPEVYVKKLSLAFVEPSSFV